MIALAADLVIAAGYLREGVYRVLAAIEWAPPVSTPRQIANIHRAWRGGRPLERAQRPRLASRLACEQFSAAAVRSARLRLSRLLSPATALIAGDVDAEPFPYSGREPPLELVALAVSEARIREARRSRHALPALSYSRGKRPGAATRLLAGPQAPARRLVTLMTEPKSRK